MKNYSWETTIPGLALIATGIYMFITTKSYVEAGACIAAGIGLMRAKDANKTGLPS